MCIILLWLKILKRGFAKKVKGVTKVPAPSVTKPPNPEQVSQTLSIPQSKTLGKGRGESREEGKGQTEERDEGAREKILIKCRCIRKRRFRHARGKGKGVMKGRLEHKSVKALGTQAATTESRGP